MREAGVVRKELSGEEAAPYVGYARTVLGQLKNQMSFAQLQQGKLTRLLPDGTLVVAQSVFGHDKITILAPTPTPQKQIPEEGFVKAPGEVEVPVELVEPPTEDVEFAALRIVGTSSSIEDGRDFGVVWSGMGKVLHVLAGLPGSFGETVTDISDNALVVVGYSRLDSGFEPWRWTEAGGTVSLGTLGAFGISQASAVSADGAVVVGHAEGVAGGGNGAWVWRAETGCVLLPTPGYASSADAISPNAKYIAGTLSQISPDGVASDGAVWINETGPQLIPRPGTSTDLLAPAPPFQQTIDTSRPTDVSDQGVVVGTTPHQYTASAVFTDTVTDSPTRLGFGAGTFVSGGPVYFYDQSKLTTSFFYDVVGGEYRTIEAGSVTASASARPDVVVGSVQHFTLRPAHQTTLTGWFTGDPLDFSTYLQQHSFANQVVDTDFSEYVRDYSSGFRMVQGAQTRFEDLTVANDVTEDGAVVVGSIRSASVAQVFPTPCMWIGTRRVDLELPAGTQQGEATAVADPQTTLHADGQVSPTSSV